MKSTDTLYSRRIEPRVVESLADTPVVMISGPRQSGKTTLVRSLAASQSMRYLTLDDELTRMAATEDPVGMIRALDRAVIDEIQRAPQLLLAIKKTIDEDRRPGRFLLTGSANLMTLPTVADSLAGLNVKLSIVPLSQSEMLGGTANWLDSLFNGSFPEPHNLQTGEVLVEAVLRGGYPESVSRATSRRRIAWARQYLDALIQRDVRDLASVDRLDALPRFLRALAQVSGQLCNYSQLGAQLQLDHKTAARYVGLFEQMFLLRRIDVYAANRLSRVIKTPKLQFIDSGLLASLLDFSPTVAKQDRSRFGSLLETFVYGELRKHASTADGEYQQLYYRDHDQYEVDLVIEDVGGQIIGVVVKAAASIKTSDLRGLKRLASTTGDRFKMGVVLYDGEEIMPMGDRLCAAPISTLWGKALGNK